MGPLCYLGEAPQGQVALVTGQKWQLKLTLYEPGSGPWVGRQGRAGWRTEATQQRLSVKIVGIYLTG